MIIVVTIFYSYLACISSFHEIDIWRILWFSVRVVFITLTTKTFIFLRSFLLLPSSYRIFAGNVSILSTSIAFSIIPMLVSKILTFREIFLAYSDEPCLSKIVHNWSGHKIHFFFSKLSFIITSFLSFFKSRCFFLRFLDHIRWDGCF